MATGPRKDLPTLTEQIQANGERLFNIRGDFIPLTFPVRLVVRNPDGCIIAEEILHEPPPAAAAPPETRARPAAEAEEYFRELRAGDPELYRRLAPELLRMGLILPG
ncbi:MAG: hypothetical protein OXI83_19905 [Gemmatimonadota bacterium]|nr:hypothetical protein [Gemmatimonadota bacterium]